MRHHRAAARPPRAAPPSAFTLVEVLVALSIMAMLMVALYTTLNSTLRARDQLETEARVAGLGPGLLDIIESDLRRAWILSIEGDQVFLGESRTIDGEAADSLSFLTSVDSTVTRRVDDHEVFADLCETGYKLRRNETLPDVRELWRRQSFHVDEQPLSDGVWERLHDRVVSFQVRYLETVDRYAEKLPDWDAGKHHKLPALVDIELALEAVPRTTEDLGRKDGSRTLRYHRVIDLRPRSDLCMRVHPIPPEFLGAEGDGVGDAQDDFDNDGIPNGSDPDIDNDDILNEPDDDDDNDGILDVDDDSPWGGSGGGPGGKGNEGDGGGADGDGDTDDPFGGDFPGGDGGGGDPGDFGDFLEDLLDGEG